MSYIPLPLAVVEIIVVVFSFILIKINSSVNRFSRKNATFEKTIRILLLILSLIIILISIVIVSMLFNNIYNPANIPPTPTIEELSEKIERISRELSTSSKELLEIQMELENRIETVEALKREAEIAENVISLTSEQVNAIQAKLNQELAASNGQNTIISVIINTVFFALGLITQPIIRFVKNKFGNQQPAETDTEMKLPYSKDEIKRAIELLAVIDREEKSKE